MLQKGKRQLFIFNRFNYIHHNNLLLIYSRVSHNNKYHDNHIQPISQCLDYINKNIYTTLNEINVYKVSSSYSIHETNILKMLQYVKNNNKILLVKSFTRLVRDINQNIIRLILELYVKKQLIFIDKNYETKEELLMDIYNWLGYVMNRKKSNIAFISNQRRVNNMNNYKSTGVVNIIIQMRNNNISYEKISKYLNEHGYRKSYGKDFDRRTVKHIFDYWNYKL